MSFRDLSFATSVILVGITSLALGEERCESKHPKRIVSSSLASDEILVELLAPCLDRVAALSPLATSLRFSNIVSVAKKVGRTFHSDPEHVADLKSDLLILAPFHRPELARRLRHTASESLVLEELSSFADIIKNVRSIGQRIGEGKRANALVSRIEAQLDSLAKAKGSTLPKVMNFSPDGRVMGSGTMFSSIVEAAGGRNLVGKGGLGGWPKMGDEWIAAQNPDYVVAMGRDKEQSQVIATVKRTPGWKLIPAVRNDRILVVPESELLSLSHHALKAAKRMSQHFKTH